MTSKLLYYGFKVGNSLKHITMRLFKQQSVKKIFSQMVQKATFLLRGKWGLFFWGEALSRVKGDALRVTPLFFLS